MAGWRSFAPTIGPIYGRCSAVTIRSGPTFRPTGRFPALPSFPRSSPCAPRPRTPMPMPSSMRRTAVGYLTLLRINLTNRVIEVGHVLYSPSLQRTPLGTETQYLLARYVFETLGYRRYEWKCNSLNAPSR